MAVKNYHLYLAAKEPCKLIIYVGGIESIPMYISVLKTKDNYWMSVFIYMEVKTIANLQI